MVRSASLLLLVLLLACGDDDLAPGACRVSSDCGEGQVCLDGACASGGVDAGPRDGGGGEDAGGCGPGEHAVGVACNADCAHPAALPCAGAQVCDIGSGACVAEGTPGLLAGDDVACGEATCRPGTECSVDERCEPIPACGRAACTEDGSVCWGRGCAYERPAGTCTPPTLERMNMDDFLLGGDGGAFDLEFDDVCNAYAVTMISGTDYLRQLDPEGTLTIWDGVTNLNMGEVAVLREIGGEFGGGDGPGEVGLTYVCCATCGCVGADPQGVARLDREGDTSLPMVVEATPSTGAAPWSRPELDTGPYGLTWGRDRTLYVGNVTSNGDLVRASLEDGTRDELHRFEARIVATAVYGRDSLVVALEGGAIWRASGISERRDLLATVDGEVTAMVRDPLTGHLFVALGDGRVLELDGPEVAGTFLTLEGPVRIAYAPDGFLYALDPGWPRPGAVTRHALPATRD